jgi:hypothetical protein
VAHEVAHFLIDYWKPRTAAIREFGTEIAHVLDGRRVPRADERFASVLLNVPLRPYFSLLEEQGDGRFDRTEVWNAENRADRLALELLAPFGEVRSSLVNLGANTGFLLCCAAAERLLIERFGLPRSISSSYARRIAEALTGGPSALEAWGL